MTKKRNSQQAVDNIRDQIKRLHYATQAQLCRLNGFSKQRCSVILKQLKPPFTQNGRQKVYTYRKGRGDAHSLAVTDVLIDILLEYPDAFFVREPLLGIPSRPDAFVLANKTPFLLEVAITEPTASLLKKIKDYELWDGKEFNIPHCGILIIGKHKIDHPAVKVAEKFAGELIDDNSLLCYS